jgi:hypothetical protein
MATGKLRAAYETNQKTITAEFSNLQAVRGTSFHPNQTIIDRQTAENKKQLDSVTKLCEQLHDKQREEALKWPPQLSQAFRDAVEGMQPLIGEFPRELRTNYQNYIDRHFPELPKQIGARPLEASELGGPGGGERGGYGAGRGGGMPGMAPGMLPEDDDYICEWLDQAVIRDELEFPQTPSSLRIWVTQEDLWVYHTLLDVIAKTNQAAGATRMSNAAVKVVYSLEVGPRAALYSRSPGRLMVPPAIAAAVPGGEGAPAGPGAGPGGPQMGGPGRPGGMPTMERGGRGPESRFGPGAGGGTAVSPAQEQDALLSYRYLDDKGQPIVIGGAGVGEAGAAPEPAAPADPSAPAPPLDLNQFGTGYKRLPIRMELQMDARWLQHLLAFCGSEPLRVEVQEVRISPSDAAGMDGGGGGSRFGGGGERGPGGGGAAGANLFPDRTGIQTFPLQPHVKNIVIQGTIYIFNKPDLNSLEPAAEQPTAGL